MKKRLLSVWMAFVLLCTLFAGAGTLTATAEEMPTMSDENPWNAKWSAEEGGVFAMLSVGKTGFYKMAFAEPKGDFSILTLSVFDTTNHSKESNHGYIGDIEVWITGGRDTVSVGAMYLVAGREYMVVVSATNSWRNEICGGDVVITPQLCEVETTELSLDAETSVSGNMLGFYFTAEEAGDYCLRFENDMDAFVTAYETDTGHTLGQYRTVYEQPNMDSMFAVPNDRAVISLKADTTYLIGVFLYDQLIHSAISITRNDTTVKRMTIDDALCEVLAEDSYPINAACFSYEVTYEDGSTKTLPYRELAVQGYAMPMVEAVGKRIENSLFFGYYVGRKHPVAAVYRGETSYSYVLVKSVCDGYTQMKAKEKVQAGDGVFCCWVVVPQTTGVYTLGIDAVSWDVAISYAFLDEHNNYVYYGSYNGKEEGFPLIGGRPYLLSLEMTAPKDTTIFLKRLAGMPFPDAGANTWYSDAVAYAVGAGIMTGYQNGLFGTSDGIQRQDFLVMLARLDGVDLSYYADAHGLFPDVAENSYYEAAVAWGYENGIVTGYNNGEFGVGDKITREQLVTFLYRYAQYIFVDVSVKADVASRIEATYTDYANVSAFAKEAVVWAVENKVIKGKTATKIVPQGNAQRCEVAQMMYNIFLNNVF